MTLRCIYHAIYGPVNHIDRITSTLRGSLVPYILRPLPGTGTQHHPPFNVKTQSTRLEITMSVANEFETANAKYAASFDKGGLQLPPQRYSIH